MSTATEKETKDKTESKPKAKRQCKKRAYLVQVRAASTEDSWQTVLETAAVDGADKMARDWLQENAADGNEYRICRVTTDILRQKVTTRTTLIPS